jgi:hypothetical protein
MGELASLLLHFALELLPVTFHAIPIHPVTPCNQFGAWKTRFNQKSSRRAWLTVLAKIV